MFEIGNKIFQLIISLSFFSTILAYILLILKLLIGKKFSKKWQYYIWIIVLLRLFIPITFEVNIIEKQMEGQADRTEKQNFISIKNQKNKQIEKVENYSSLEKIDKNKEISYWNYLWIIWLIGIMITLVIKIVDYQNFIRYIKVNNEKVTNEKRLKIFDDITIEMNIKKEIPLYQNPLIISPMLVGIFHPFIIIPEKEIIEKNISFIFYHELTHFKRKDIWYKWFLQFLECMHWFNPMIYWINKEINRLCELSCDEAVLKRIEKKERKEYGNAILSIAELGITYKDNILSTTLCEDKKNIEERLDFIMNNKKISKKAMAGSFFMLSIFCCTALTVGAKTIANQKGGLTSYVASLVNGSGIKVLTKDLYSSSLSTLENLPSLPDLSEDVEEKKVNKFSDSAFYENKDRITGKDGNKYFSCRNYRSSKTKLTIKNLKLTGIDTIGIITVTQDTQIKMDYQMICNSGEFKIVHISPNNQINKLVENTSNGTMTVKLQKGRNRIKMVGNAAVINELKVEFSQPSGNIVTSWYTSEGSELEGKIKSNENVSIKEIIENAPYIGSTTITEGIHNAIKRGEKIEPSQIKKIAVYIGSSDLGKFVISLNKEGKIDANFLKSVAVYMGSSDLGECVVSLSEKGKIDASFLKSVAVYMGSSDLGKCVVRLSEEGKIDASFLKSVAVYMGSSDLGKCVVHLSEEGKIDASFLKSVAVHMGSSDVRQAINLLKEQNKITKEQIKELSVYY